MIKIFICYVTIFIFLSLSFSSFYVHVLGCFFFFLIESLYRHFVGSFLITHPCSFWVFFADLFICGLCLGGISYGPEFMGFFFWPRILGWGSINIYFLKVNRHRQIIFFFFHNSRTSLTNWATQAPSRTSLIPLLWKQTSS